MSGTNVCRVKNAMKLGICSCKTSREKWREIRRENSGRFRASFPEERGAAKFHQKFHGIFHDNFHARFQEKISRQHFCTPCRDDNWGHVESIPAGPLRRHACNRAYASVLEFCFCLLAHQCMQQRARRRAPS